MERCGAQHPTGGVHHRRGDGQATHGGGELKAPIRSHPPWESGCCASKPEAGRQIEEKAQSQKSRGSDPPRHRGPYKYEWKSRESRESIECEGRSSLDADGSRFGAVEAVGVDETLGRRGRKRIQGLVIPMERYVMPGTPKRGSGTSTRLETRTWLRSSPTGCRGISRTGHCHRR